MPYLHRHPLAAALLAGLLVGLLASTGARAQKAAEKKVYCWDDGGHRACGDALPPEAVGRARTEISARSGLATARVARALTDEEKAAAEQAADAERKRMEADAMAKRRDLAIVESYMTETDLRRAYGERTALLDETLKASRLGIDNLRLSLMSQLRQAGDRELASEVVPKPMLAAIQQLHDDLLRQQRILSDQMRDRAVLDLELEDTLRRYRALKASAYAKPTRATASTAANKPGLQR
jgi:hypothetical protein